VTAVTAVTNVPRCHGPDRDGRDTFLRMCPLSRSRSRSRSVPASNDAVAAGLHEDGKPIGQNKPLRDARKVLGVESMKSGAHSARWVWMPPTPKVPSKAEGAHSWGRAPSAKTTAFNCRRLLTNPPPRNRGMTPDNADSRK
jgi:hypothetical protein